MLNPPDRDPKRPERPRWVGIPDAGDFLSARSYASKLEIYADWLEKEVELWKRSDGIEIERHCATQESLMSALSQLAALRQTGIPAVGSSDSDRRQETAIRLLSQARGVLQTPPSHQLSREIATFMEAK